MTKASETIREVLMGLALDQKFYASTIVKAEQSYTEELDHLAAELEEAVKDDTITGITVLILYDAAD